MNQVCYETELAGFRIELRQRGVDTFTVTYGKQVKTRLDYSEAAHELGACMMHALACEGKLDNREPGE